MTDRDVEGVMEPMTEAGRALLDELQIAPFSTSTELRTFSVGETRYAIAAIEAEAASAALAAAGKAVDEVIFDLPIGEDVTYSRGYSAGIAAARESLRDAIDALINGAKP